MFEEQKEGQCCCGMVNEGEKKMQMFKDRQDKERP